MLGLWPLRAKAFVVTGPGLHFNPQQPQLPWLRPGVRWKARNLKQARRGRRTERKSVFHTVQSPGCCGGGGGGAPARWTALFSALLLGLGRPSRSGWNQSQLASTAQASGGETPASVRRQSRLFQRAPGRDFPTDPLAALLPLLLASVVSAPSLGRAEWKESWPDEDERPDGLLSGHMWEDADSANQSRDFCQRWPWHHFLFLSPREDGRMLKKNNKRKDVGKYLSAKAEPCS